MILTVTPHPSIDRTVALPEPLRSGAVHRAESVLSHPGGKGVNISRACVAADVPTCAVLPLEAHDPLVDALARAGVTCRPVDAPGPVRVNLTITDPAGTTTKINTPGATFTPVDARRLTAAVVTAADELAPDWIALAGSLPPGTAPTWYAETCSALRGHGHRVAVDTSDEPLAVFASATGTRRPDLLKPNAEELATLTGTDAHGLEQDPERAAHAARTYLGTTASSLLVTLGGDGALLVTPEGTWRATPPPITVVSTVGAGDASLFGYLQADRDGRPPAERLRLAVAYGSAAAGLAGTTTPRPADLRTDEIDVEPLELTPAGGTQS